MTEYMQLGDMTEQAQQEVLKAGGAIDKFDPENEVMAVDFPAGTEQCGTNIILPNGTVLLEEGDPFNAFWEECESTPISVVRCA